MAERLKRAAAWLGLVTDDRYPDYDDAAEFEDLTEEDHSVEPLDTSDKAATVTPLESRRTGTVAAAAGRVVDRIPIVEVNRCDERHSSGGESGNGEKGTRKPR